MKKRNIWVFVLLVFFVYMSPLQGVEESENIRVKIKYKNIVEKIAIKAATSEIPQEKAPFKRIYIRASYGMGFSSGIQNVSWQKSIYHENASFGIKNTFEKGNSISFSVGYRLLESLGVELGMDLCSRNIIVSYDASIPHPIFFNTLRSADGSGSYNLTENAVFLNLVYSFWYNRFGIDIFAGPAYYLASAELIKEVGVIESSYPYESINVSAGTEELSKNSFGFNTGVRLNFFVVENIGIFIKAQYLYGKADFIPNEDIGTISISHGGLKAGAGIIVSF